MTAIRGKGPVFDPGLCRCCGTMKKCRVLNIEYESSGLKEIYSDMVMDCFGLLVRYPHKCTAFCPFQINGSDYYFLQEIKHKL